MFFKRSNKNDYVAMTSNGGFLTDETSSDTRDLIEETFESENEVPTVQSLLNGNANLLDGDSQNITHCHDANWSNVQFYDRRAERVLWVVAFLSTLFIGLEFVGGFLAHSLAIMSDAGHMVSDLISFLISIVAIRTARAAPTRRLSFGYARAEVLGACASMVLLWVITVVLVIFAIERIIDNKLDVDPDTMLYTAGAGVIFNIIMAIVLQCGGQGHNHSHHGMPSNHGHSHSESERNVNVRAAFIHVIGDLIQSIGVLVAAVVVKYTDWKLADPICTFIFSIIVLFTSVPVMRDIGGVLMEATPRHVDVSLMKKELLSVSGVKGVHDIHVWALNMGKLAMSAHLAVETADNAIYATAEARSLLSKKYNLHSITLQTELHEKSMSHCEGCVQVV